MIGIDRKMAPSFDWPLLVMMLALMLFGFVAIANATCKPVTDEVSTLAGSLKYIDWYYPRMQMYWAAAGVALMVVVLLVDYRYIQNIAWVIFAVLVLLLAAVLMQPAQRGDNRAWFKIGSVRTFQPSEIGKLAIIVVLASRLAKIGKPITRLWEFITLLPYIVVPVGLIVLQKDVGTMLVYVAIFFGMLFASGINMRLFIGIIAVTALILVPLWFIMGDFRQQRILNFLYPERDVQDSGYNVKQAIIAIGSGQWLGKGLFQRGAFAQLNYVPEKHTDFVFSVTAEALGFVGAIGLVVVFVVFMWRMLHIASTTSDRFGNLIIVGVVSMLLFHTFENIGMNIGITPVTGIPLPFISYGGSNLWTNMIATAFVLNVGLRRNKRPIT